MGRVNFAADPYEYPAEAHRRRHGPAGYSDYASYGPWLADEFTFRCVYCLKRAVWAPTDTWVVDHLISRDEAPQLECDYDNLVLACQFCNGRKGPNRVPDPCRVAYGDCLRVERDGTITDLNKPGGRLLKVLRLNHKCYVEWRRGMIHLISVLAKHDRTLFERLMRFPSDLPDLAHRHPPRNSRPEGIAESHFARRQRCELPPVY